MALWAERQVRRDLGMAENRRKHQSFGKLFQTPPHAAYTAREPRTAGRLRRLVGTNVVQLTNCDFMERLEHRTIQAYREDLQERMDERARQAAELAHIQLWESVLRGQSTLPPEKLGDPCMRQVRQHQLKIEALQQQAIKLGTSVLRVATMPHVWSEPSHYKPPKRKKRAESPDQHRSRTCLKGQRSSLYMMSSSMMMAAGEPSSTTVGRCDSWRSRRMVVKWSDEARAKRSRSVGCFPAAAFGYQYRKLTAGDSELELKTKKNMTICCEDGTMQHRDRRLSRVNPPSRPPVVFPEAGPQLLLLSCDTQGGRVVMKPLGTSDFIIPRYYRPKAPDLLRDAKDLDEMYRVSNFMFYGAYPSMDNREWHTVFSSRMEKKLQQDKQAQGRHPVKSVRLV